MQQRLPLLAARVVGYINFYILKNFFKKVLHKTDGLCYTVDDDRADGLFGPARRIVDWMK